MLCLFCSTTDVAGGTHLGVRLAQGVCHQCGAGVCLHHAQVGDGSNGVLLCPRHADGRTKLGAASSGGGAGSTG
jgi:hypothetical protein